MCGYACVGVSGCVCLKEEMCVVMRVCLKERKPLEVRYYGEQVSSKSCQFAENKIQKSPNLIPLNLSLVWFRRATDMQ